MAWWTMALSLARAETLVVEPAVEDGFVLAPHLVDRISAIVTPIEPEARVFVTEPCQGTLQQHVVPMWALPGGQRTETALLLGGGQRVRGSWRLGGARPRFYLDGVALSSNLE